jgi:flagellar biosynthesis regulator FlbT
LPVVHRFLDDFAVAAPSTADLVEEIRGFVQAGQYYRALKAAKQLIAREQEILSYATV